MHELREAILDEARTRGAFGAVYDEPPTALDELPAVVFGEIVADPEEAKNVARTLFRGSYRLSAYLLVGKTEGTKTQRSTLVSETLGWLGRQHDFALSEEPGALRYWDGHIHPYDLHCAEIQLSRPSLIDITDF